MAIKVAMIGAGSIGFTRRLMHDILTVDELKDTEFAFMDINKRNLDMIYKLAKRDIEANGLPAKVTATMKQREAVKNADYVFCMARVGGLEAFQHDIDIPLKYGVDQCVGDTLAPGGIMYGQRGIPVILGICKDIREVAKPDCVFMNYSNPMAMLTWAANHYGQVNTIGLCHGVEASYTIMKNIFDCGYEDLDCVAAGLNHQTWFLSVRVKGKDVTHKVLERIEKHPTYSKTEKCRIDVLRRFGYWSTESNGHLSEYLPWYRKRTNEIKKWIDLGTWIHGETGGYLRVCTEGRNWFEHDFPRWMKEDPPTITPEKRSAERGSYIVEAMETNRPRRLHFNRVNNGIISNLPDDCVIEGPGYVDARGVHMIPIGDLPLQCAATLSASVNVQRMAVEAAVHGDVFMLRQAMLHDPLTAAVCNPPEVWQLADRMLVAQAEWLPQYKREVTKAEKRLAAEKDLGTSKSKGAARIKTKSVQEMERNAEKQRKLAQASDKAEADRASEFEKASKKKRAAKKRTAR